MCTSKGFYFKQAINPLLVCVKGPVSSLTPYYSIFFYSLRFIPKKIEIQTIEMFCIFFIRISTIFAMNNNFVKVIIPTILAFFIELL